jgi:hypothetical protein
LEKLLMADENIVVHVTHEAAGKIGGIGAVLQGFFTCPSYLQAVNRSILVSPLFATDGSGRTARRARQVLYSSIDGLINPGTVPRSARSRASTTWESSMGDGPLSTSRPARALTRKSC